MIVDSRTITIALLEEAAYKKIFRDLLWSERNRKGMCNKAVIRRNKGVIRVYYGCNKAVIRV